MTEELFLRDSYLQSCRADIVEIEDEKVVLNQTVFYPTGGGQEHDTGMLIQNDRSFEVYQVKRENGKIVHFVKNAQDLTFGEVTVKIDWKRRNGLMRHHSLLHVLGSVVYEKYGALSTGNKIYNDRARIDFNNLSELTEEEIKEIAQESNRIIKKNHSIFSRYVTRDEAENSSGLIKTAISLLPASVTSVRLVSIENIDEQACGGTHVKQTGEIGEMFIKKVKSKGKHNMRFDVYVAT